MRTRRRYDTIANEYTVPHILPDQWGMRWWQYIFAQKSLVSSMIQSFIVAIVTTGVVHAAVHSGGLLHRPF